jgi:Mg2+-importing ATPase
VLLNQLRNPLLLVLVFAAAASALTGEWVDAHIVLAIVFASVGVGYAREYQAEVAAADLQARIRSRARMLRDGHPLDLPVEEIVPGDVVLLSAGSLMPADGDPERHRLFHQRGRPDRRELPGHQTKGRTGGGHTAPRSA